MNLRVYNSPEVDQLKMADAFKSGETTRDRQFSPGYSYVKQSYLGTDALQLSEDFDYRQKRARPASYSGNTYSALLKIMFVLLIGLGLVAGALAFLIALGGILSAVVFALMIFFAVFLYSINMNPFDGGTYKRLSSLLFSMLT